MTKRQDRGELDLAIDGFSVEGEGIGRALGRAVFVPRCIPGEKVRVRLLHPSGRRLEAELLEILAPSRDRVEPRCPVFGRCGGCQLLHVDYRAQLPLKSMVAADALRSIARLEVGSLAVAAAKEPFRYRNHGQFPFAVAGSGIACGFFAARSHRVIPVEDCLLQDRVVQAAALAVRDWARQATGESGDPGITKGWLRHVVARVGGGEVLVTLVARRDADGDYASLLRQLREKVPALRGLLLNVNTRNSPVVLGPRSRVLWGEGFLEESFMGLSFRLSPGSFFQVNPHQAEVLYSRVLSFLGRPAAPVVDAYCGVGALALLLAARGHEVAGIEAMPETVADARAAARENRLEATFHQGKVERVLPRLLAAGFRPAAVILDPPRRGCEVEVLSALAASRIGRIAYLSCHPGTLARDLSRLLAHGYRLEAIEGVDMFPQTAHLEMFAGLVRV